MKDRKTGTKENGKQFQLIIYQQHSTNRDLHPRSN